MYPLGPDVWKDTVVQLPASTAGLCTDMLTGKQLHVREKMPVGELFSDLPVSLLTSNS
jgi:maltooligosyltrehalose synthase